MTIKEAIEYWEQFKAETDDLYETCSDVERDILAKQREVAEFTISALRDQQEKPFGGWISVKDKLPEVGKWEKNHVLTINDVGRFRVAYYDGYCWRDLQKQCIGLLAPFTHWMPLPPPPQEV